MANESTICIDDINNQLKQMHITGYYFGPMVDISTNNNDLSQKIINKVSAAQRLRNKKNLEFVLFSDKNVKHLFNLFKRNFADSDLIFLEYSKMKKKFGPKVFLDATHTDKKMQKWRDTMSAYGYKARGASIFELTFAQPLLGVIVFFSDKEPEELSKALEDTDRFSKAVDALAHAHIKSLNARTNPWVALGAISTNSHEILQHLAEGKDTLEISETMSMTKRGVDYHIDTLKELLQAKNRIQLVAKALKEGIIT